MPANRFFHVNLNVMDLDRAIAFYAVLGFEVVHRQRLDAETMRGTNDQLGIGENGAEFALVRLGDDPSAPFIDLVQWDDTIDRHSIVNERGACRIAIDTDDRDGVLQRLIDADAEFVGPMPPKGVGSMFVVRDPDGVFVEIVTGLVY